LIMTKTGIRWHRMSQLEDDDWITDHRAFDHAILAGIGLLAAVRPGTRSRRPSSLLHIDAHTAYARRMLNVLRGRARLSTSPTMNRIRELLGPILAQMATRTPKEPKS
jgi:hypothetical protein